MTIPTFQIKYNHNILAFKWIINSKYREYLNCIDINRRNRNALGCQRFSPTKVTITMVLALKFGRKKKVASNLVLLKEVF